MKLVHSDARGAGGAKCHLDSSVVAPGNRIFYDDAAGTVDRDAIITAKAICNAAFNMKCSTGVEDNAVAAAALVVDRQPSQYHNIVPLGVYVYAVTRSNGDARIH